MSSTVYRVAGPTQALSVINVSQASITVTYVEPSNYASFVNVGGSPVLVSVVTLNQNPNPIFPTITSGPVAGILLPPLMNEPIMFAVPNPFNAAAISNSATASLVYVTPMVPL